MKCLPLRRPVTFRRLNGPPGDRGDRRGRMVVFDEPSSLHHPHHLPEEGLAALLVVAGNLWHRRRVVGEPDQVVGRQLLLELGKLPLHK